MFEATCAQICAVTGASQLCGRQDLHVQAVAIDSRTLPARSLFIAFGGGKVNGNDYVCAAFEAGAAAALMTRDPYPEELAAAEDRGGAILLADNAQDCLAALASWWRAQVGCVVVGVTGSSGKTTTRSLITGVLSTQLRTHTATRNYNSLIGCPLTILACPRDAQAMVIEMGMDQAGEIAAMCRMAAPDIAVVTNVGVAHMETMGSRDNIAKAKAEIIGGLSGTRAAHRVFLCAEDDYAGWMAHDVAGPHGVQALTYGFVQDADIRATDIRSEELGQPTATITLAGGQQLEATVSISGKHNMLNALAAAGVGEALGISPDNIAAGLARVEPERMHQNVSKLRSGAVLVDDSYNGNPCSMRRAIDQLVDDIPGERKIACLGDMLGLEPDSALYHAMIGAYAAGRGVDVLLCVGPLSQHMAQAARLMGMDANSVFEAASPEAAAAILKPVLTSGDVLVVIASRGTGLDKVVAELDSPAGVPAASGVAGAPGAPGSGATAADAADAADAE